VFVGLVVSAIKSEVESLLETFVEGHFRDVIEAGHVGLVALMDVHFGEAVDSVDPNFKHHNYIISKTIRK
jgi:acyl CoA:acetate/3-ketoacid CoA transferase